MTKVLVGIENSYTNAPLVWAKKSNLFRRNELEIELIELPTREYGAPRKNLFNALDDKKVDLIIAPFENAVERIAATLSVTIVKQFSRLANSSACYALKEGETNDRDPFFLGFPETDFEFEIFSAKRGMSKKMTRSYFMVDSAVEAIEAMKEDERISLFSSKLSNSSIDIPFELEVVDVQANESPTSVMLIHELPDGSFNTTSGMSHNQFVSILSQFASSIQEAVGEIRESTDAVKDLASAFDCSKVGLGKQLQNIEWPSGFEPALSATQEITQLMTSANLSAACDFYDPAEFWKTPTNGDSTGE
ncbi:hypothetical protein OAG71_00715 [bacterium]|nr:hypothetical protein [bacterium]